MQICLPAPGTFFHASRRPVGTYLTGRFLARPEAGYAFTIHPGTQNAGPSNGPFVFAGSAEVKSISARIGDKVYGRVSVGSRTLNADISSSS